MGIISSILEKLVVGSVISQSREDLEKVKENPRLYKGWGLGNLVSELARVEKKLEHHERTRQEINRVLYGGGSEKLAKERGVEESKIIEGYSTSQIFNENKIEEYKLRRKLVMEEINKYKR